MPIEQMINYVLLKGKLMRYRHSPAGMLSLLTCLTLLLSLQSQVHAQFVEGAPPESAYNQATHPYIEVLEPRVGDKAWLQAIKKVKKQKFNDKNRYSLIRVIQDDSTPKMPVMLSATKLMELTNKYNGGGGQFFNAQNGDFVLWQHLTTPSPQNPRAMIKVGHPNSGALDLWLDIPERGQLRTYEIIFETCPKNQYGQLQIQVLKHRSTQCTQFTVGMITTGGIYGKTYPLNPRKRRGPILLAPGDYKLLFPEIDKRKARFDFQIHTRQTTKLKFKAPSQNLIVLEEEKEPEPKKDADAK